MERIVVGIDGSDGARRALEWGLHEAALRGAELHLVHAYPTPELVALPAVVTLPSDDELRAAAEEVIAEVLAEVGGSGDVPVTTTVMAGGAAAVMCELAKDASLMVVGARGLGGFRGLLLGSVTHQVVAHSPCPVVVAVPRDR
ncbi:MAG: universal stress protein [Nitriliruptoraceae bacterium]|nr:universal stress protein [Nitriliruptoraceae bacterium]